MSTPECLIPQNLVRELIVTVLTPSDSLSVSIYGFKNDPLVSREESSSLVIA
jgi:hypothetical protein